MRTIPITLTLFVMLVPLAAAGGETTVDAPDARVWVEGQRLAADSAQVVKGTTGLSVVLETKDQELVVDGPSCTVNTDAEGAKKLPSACRAKPVETPRASVADLVQASIDLRLPESEDGSRSDAAPTAQDAAVAAFEVTGGRVMLAAAAAGVSLAALYGVWRVLKWTGIAAFIPLYSHLKDDEILDDANRSGIYRLIQTEPGISTKDIADRLGLAWGTVTHHLGKLEKRRFVVSKKYGKYRRYFANGQGGTDQKDQVAVLRLDRTGDVAALIRAHPGLTQKAVSQTLGVSSSTILWHVKRLEGAQLVTKVREGKQVRYYPGEGLDRVLVAPAAPASPVTAA